MMRNKEVTTLIAREKKKEEYPTNPVTGCPLWIENYANAAKNKFEDEKSC